MVGCCDNADCRNTGEVELYPVKMKGIFADGGIYNWCRECIDRDEGVNDLETEGIKKFINPGNNEDAVFEKDEEGRFICPHCEKSMESISQTQYVIVKWKWNGEKYIKLPDDGDGDSEKPMCDHCGEHIAWEYGELLGY